MTTFATAKLTSDEKIVNVVLQNQLNQKIWNL
jgi:hypothetical protein